MRLFIDMDGCLAVFLKAAREADLYKQGYFENLPAQSNILEAVKSLANRVDCYILSSYLEDSPYALCEKNAWLDRYFPEIKPSHRVFTPCGTSKVNAVMNYNPLSDVLVDDYGINCSEWKEKGGRYVKVSLNELDAEKEALRHQYTIHPQMSATKIADIICQVLECPGR